MGAAAVHDGEALGMTPPAQLATLRTELERVVDRLNSMPLHRATTVAAGVNATAAFLLARTRELTDEIPAGAVLPELAAQGLGSLIAVLGDDLINAAKAAPKFDAGPVIDRLIELRRSLP